MFINYNLILDVFLKSIIPLTKKNINKGNKIFGAAILKKKDFSVVTIGINNEIINPLFHGEISAINNFFKQKINLTTKECIFLSTHEPCSLCLSAITWSGFDNFYYFFPYTDTDKKFKIPHDLKILHEIFYINQGKYNKSNNYWKSYSILNEINKLPLKEKEILKEKIDIIVSQYEKFSNHYQSFKINNNIPLN